MNLTKNEGAQMGRLIGLSRAALVAMGILLGNGLPFPPAQAQAISTTTVQGTVYLANGQPASGQVFVSWPAFATTDNQAVTAGKVTATIAANGFLSLNLAPNLGATPAGLYYTAVFHLSDGTTSTEYWVVPATTPASLASVRAQLMPSTQAVQAVSKAYVDQQIAELAPAGPLSNMQLGAAFQADQFPGADFGAKLSACLQGLNATYGGICDARNFTGTQSMGTNLTISVGNATVLLPCATIATSNQLIVTAGVRNVTLRGCALRGGSSASGNQGGTVFLYSGSAAMVQVGDPTFAADTQGFHLDDVVINTTEASSATAEGLTAYRTQELDLESLYFLGNSNQTGMTLDGTGNYTGGTFFDNALNGFQIAVNAVGHTVANAATTDWMNASTFVRLHIDCPTSGGNPITGTYGINLQQGDGNTFTGGDVEGCDTALHLGANAQNNTLVGVRNENSNNQIVADAGSAYNNWITGGTIFTGKLTDNGTRNSFLDTFHRSFNGIKGDWYGSQQDATVTNHYRIGIGAGNERGLLDRYQTDYGYRWTMGLSDATAGEQFYQVLDELNNVYRLSIGQYNNVQSSTNNQTVINAAGTGAVVLNGSNNSGTGGVVFGSGGASETTVATINNAGNAQFNGTLQVGGVSTFTGSTTVKNQADSEIDSFLWAGATASQKESLIYKDWNGSSQWYLVKDASNNWALNSALGGLDSFKAYQSTNSGDTYINASNGTGHIRLNYETGSGAETDIYAGSSANLVAAFLGATAIKFPGLAASSGHNCLQIDNSGYLSNSGASCGGGNLASTWSALPSCTSGLNGVVYGVTDIGDTGSNWNCAYSNHEAAWQWAPVGGNVNLAVSGIPFGIPSSGTVGNNGALTLTTAFPHVFSRGIYLYFPSGAIYSGSVSGLYWTVMSSTTAGTIYNNVYSPSTTTVPSAVASPTAFSTTGPGAYTQTTNTNIQLASFTIPANLMGQRGELWLSSGWDTPATSTGKMFGAMWAGTAQVLINNISTTNYGGNYLLVVKNQESVTQQYINFASNGFGASAVPVWQTTNTATAQNVVHVAKLVSAATDYIVLENWEIQLRRP